MTWNIISIIGLVLVSMWNEYEKFEYISSLNSKDSQHNGHKKKDMRANNDLQNMCGVVRSRGQTNSWF